MRNTSEYSSKLQLHQHSLLTRKVFFRHNFQHKASSLYHIDLHRVLVIFKSSSSSSHLDLQVIFIFKSSSSSDLDHHSIWIITGHHHWIWIITGHHHWIWIITGSGSSLNLDHFFWIIITQSGSSLGHLHGCYLLILLIIGISIEPALFHVGCTSTVPVLFHTGCIITQS